MKAQKRVLLFVVLIALVVMAGCGGKTPAGTESGNNTVSTGTSASDKVSDGESLKKVVMAFITFNKIPDSMDRINGSSK